LTTQNSYQNIASFYDSFQGSARAKNYLKLIKKQAGLEHIKGLEVLEVACGTGEILKLLSDQHETFGIDISPEMIKLARQKDKKSTYQIGDMRSFDLGKKFDLILCPYDSINHLLSFSDWEKTFANIKNHLKDKGKFIFDYNTLKKFKEIDGKEIKIEVDEGFVLISTKLKNNLCYWHIEKKLLNNLKSEKDQTAEVVESSFSKDEILTLLKKYYKNVATFQMESGRNLLICE